MTDVIDKNEGGALTKEEQELAKSMVQDMGPDNNMMPTVATDFDDEVDLNVLQKNLHKKEIKEIKDEHAEDIDEKEDEIARLNAKLAEAKKKRAEKTKEDEIAELKEELARSKKKEEREAKITQLNAELKRTQLDNARKDEIATLKAELAATKVEKEKDIEIEKLRAKLAMQNKTKETKAKEDEISQLTAELANAKKKNVKKNVDRDIDTPAKETANQLNQQSSSVKTKAAAASTQGSGNGTLYGWWKCVGEDSKRCVGKYCFFDQNGNGFFCIASPVPEKIDKKKKYTIFSQSMNSYLITWENENGSTGVINTFANGDKLQCNGRDWLIKTKKKLLV